MGATNRETPASVRSADGEFVITRIFDARRELVWKAWTEPERLQHWWGPKGFKIVSCKVDLRPGGVFHYGLQMPDGREMWGKFIYQEIVKPERLVFIVSFSDEKGGVTRHPFVPNWPLETLSTVLFEEQGATTKIIVKWVPHSATEIERKTFEDGSQSMQQGWTGTFDQLAEYLAKA
jgi:uncharacterized protein YndB with AHSA1/START domain